MNLCLGKRKVIDLWGHEVIFYQNLRLLDEKSSQEIVPRRRGKRNSATSAKKNEYKSEADSPAVHGKVRVYGKVKFGGAGLP